MEKIWKHIVRAASAEEELKDVVPLRYNKEVLVGESKITLVMDSVWKKAIGYARLQIAIRYSVFGSSIRYWKSEGAEKFHI